MQIYLVLFITSLFLLIIIDGVWLATMSKRFYSKQIGHLMAEKPNFVAVVIFYLIYLIALNYLVLTPAYTSSASYFEVFLRAAVFGLAAYGTYDLTNQGTLKKWPWKLTIIDLIWGSLLTGFVALGAVYFSKMFLI